jgi:glycosyltransferase involved in cell wall biosynthesis
VTPVPALVHDYLLTMRGAERTFAAIAAAWPTAPIFTLLFDAAGTEGRFAGRDVTTSPLQQLRIRQDGFRRFLPLFPLAVAQLPLDGHQLVISSSSAFAHGVRPPPDAVHICYCHSPFRYAWHGYPNALEEVPRPLQPALGLVLRHIRRWDREAARRVTQYVVNSRTTQDLIMRYYGRASVLVHPPVEVDRFHIGKPEDFFLVVCELVRHKRVDVAAEAARRAGVPLKVVGSGPELKRLETLHGDAVQFLGRLGDSELADLYARARALVVPSVEEFGIAAVEAQAAGRPVVAVAAGGSLETVVEGQTGVLVKVDAVDDLAQALRHVDFDKFDPARMTAHARRFSVDAFQQRMRDVVDQTWASRATSPAILA